MMVYRQNIPVAYCWTRIFTGARGVSGPEKGEIHMLGVDPDYRNQSIGRNVLLAGLLDLKQSGIREVELTADGQEPAALALYASVGFKKYTRIDWFEKKLMASA
jgi:ribosomal protein S18 acetylase RimI-like enzyme